MTKFQQKMGGLHADPHPNLDLFAGFKLKKDQQAVCPLQAEMLNVGNVQKPIAAEAFGQ